MTPALQPILDKLNGLHPPFWKDPGYVIAILIGIVGLAYSYKAFKEAGKAFREARSAKEAATAAGRTVKIQTVTIELSEVTQMLDRVEPGMLFREARDLLAEVQRRVRRHVAPFAEHPRLSGAIKTTLQALETAHKSLKGARPADAANEKEAPNAVYNAIEDDFATINNCVADLMGLFEKVTLGLGEGDGEA
jgi:hypothetical protein